MTADRLIHNAHLPLKLPNFDDYPISKEVASALNAAYSGENVAAVGPQAQMALTDYRSGNLDVLYYGPIQMGSGQQRLTFDVDTGSADLWVSAHTTRFRCDGADHSS